MRKEFHKPDQKSAKTNSKAVYSRISYDRTSVESQLLENPCLENNNLPPLIHQAMKANK